MALPAIGVATAVVVIAGVCCRRRPDPSSERVSALARDAMAPPEAPITRGDDEKIRRFFHSLTFFKPEDETIKVCLRFLLTNTSIFQEASIYVSQRPLQGDLKSDDVCATLDPFQDPRNVNELKFIAYLKGQYSDIWSTLPAKFHQNDDVIFITNGDLQALISKGPRP